jgi:hypothetical protein
MTKVHIKKNYTDRGQRILGEGAGLHGFPGFWNLSGIGSAAADWTWAFSQKFSLTFTPKLILTRLIQGGIALLSPWQWSRISLSLSSLIS